MSVARQEKVDGRELRAIKNRQSIIDAVVELGIRGEHPTIDEIAHEAGVSVRSVYRHFDNLDEVRSIAADQIVRIVTGYLKSASGPIDVDRPLAMRCNSLVAARFALHDSIGTLVRNVGRRGPDRSRATAEHDAAVQIVSEQVGALFAPEFDAMAAADRTLAHAMVDALTAFETVDQLLTTDGADRVALADLLCKQLLTVFGTELSAER